MSKNLQKQSLDIAAAASQVEALNKELKFKRSDDESFDRFWNASQELAQKIGVSFSEPRTRKISRRIDDRSHNQVKLSDKESLKVFFQRCFR